MGNPAAYVTLHDKTVTLQSGDKTSHEFRFDAPDVDAGHKSVLTFVADPFGDNTVSLEWDLNGTDILTNGFNTGEARLLQEIVGTELLLAQDNSLVVRLTDTDTSAAIKLDDVVLLYTTQQP
jgi:hypothetical protein